MATVHKPGRIFLQPGMPVPEAGLQRHRQRHVALAGERLTRQSQNFFVFSDGTPEGDAAAQAILQHAEADYVAVQQWFPGVTLPSLPFNVYLDPGAGGAYHITCAGTDIHVLPDPDRAPGFLVAEVVEVFEATLNNGWDCGLTNGESLSRVLAFDRYPTLAQDFAGTEQDWWAQGHQDYVTDNSADDRNQPASGCGDLFLYYLHTQLTFSWAAITTAGGGSLGATYQALAGYGGAQGFSDFITVLTSIDQGGVPALPPSGNPFPIKV